MTLVLRSAAVVAVVSLAVVLVGACDKIKKPLQPTNLAPVVRLTAAPIDTNAVCVPDPARSCYSLTLNWVGYDPDGRVDHFIYAVDPGDNDTTWIVTTENEKRLVFESPSQSPRADSLTILRGYHVFVIAAVDNDRAVGPRAFRAFFSFTKAPTVRFTNPRPTGPAEKLLPPSIRISWSGTDDDGVFTSKPVRYKYLLLGPGNETSVIPGGINEILASGGSAIRRYYAPEFRSDQGWISTSGDSTTVQFTNLVPGASYLFTVVAFDEAGAYSPVFLFDSNVIRFKIGYAASFGPTFTIFNESFFYRYPGGSYNPANEVRIEVPAGQLVRFNWFADPPQGADIKAYRWMLDGDVFDTRQRTDESDYTRWSSGSVNTVSATVGPFNEARDHFFYVDAEDNTGLKSLATVHFFVVVPTFADPLLIVDDTRYRPDQFLSDGSLISPQARWPGAAEMDTFMYAVGGVPWEKYPPGTMSTPGVLHGYAYDTLGTRRGLFDSSTPLATLGGYRHVIWLIDFASATFGNSGNVPNDPISSLRYMSNQGHLNSLGAYVRMGGEAWLVGGGGAYATGIPFNDRTNDVGGTSVWEHSNAKRELDAGRFMYDVPKWQVSLQSRSAQTMGATDNIVRSLGRFEGIPSVYSGLPVSFNQRTLATDPIPPLRTNNLYYLTTYACEVIAAFPPKVADTSILETVAGDDVDRKIDSFNDFLPAPVIARWPLTVHPPDDTLRTFVDTDSVTAPGGSHAAGRALRIRTAGGGLSNDDFASFDFGTNPRDWSGLATVKLAVMQDQPTSAVQWRLRATDNRGGTTSAPIPVTTPGQFADVTFTARDFVTDATSPVQPDLVRIQKIAFVLERGDVAATTEFDNLEYTTFPEGEVLDTLLAAKLSFALNPPINATMTVYHGHDFARPFIFTGFAPWEFRRSECKALFDFVLQKMWGIFPSQTLLARTGPGPFAPAHLRTTPLSRPGLRGMPSRGAAPGGGGLRQGTSPGLRSRSEGKP